MSSLNVCRLCLEENQNRLTKLEQNNELIQTIFTLTSLLILHSPMTSAFLCADCESLIVKFNQFRESCLGNDKIFRERIRGLNLKQIDPSDDPNLEGIKVEVITLKDYEALGLLDKEGATLNEEPRTLEEIKFGGESNDEKEILEKEKTKRKRSSGGVPTRIDPKLIEKSKKKTTLNISHRLLSCTQCGKMIVRGNMKKHMATHNPDAPQKICSHCGKGFKDAQLLKVHVNSHHTFETKYECDVCGKVYLRPNSLREHVLAKHSAEKRYECGVCGLKFANFSKKSYHYTAVHTTAKPFTCQYCERAFKFKCDLTLHTRTHTGEKPFVCDICGKSFNKSYNVVIHKKTHENQLQSIIP